MNIRFCRDPVFLPYINIDGAAIERVSQVKVLGVTLSSDLSWNAHVDGIVSKARKRVFLNFISWSVLASGSVIWFEFIYQLSGQ